MANQAEAGNRTRAVEVFVLIAMTGSLILAAVGTFVATKHNPGNAQPWFIWAGIVFVFTAFGAIFYFFIHPAIGALDERRVRWLADSAARKAQIRAAHSAPAATAAPAAPGAPDFAVLMAHYRVVVLPDQAQDVLRFVAPKVANGRLAFTVTNDQLGGDPYPDQGKELVIRWRANGNEYEQAFVEGSPVSLP